jgi:ankyrin repeat protein
MQKIESADTPRRFQREPRRGDRLGSIWMRLWGKIGLTALAVWISGCAGPGTDGPLHVAVVRGDLPAVRKLVDAGAEVNAEGEFGRSPLYYAALSGYREIVSFLLTKGADPLKGASWKGNNTPLHVAADHGHLGCVQVFLSWHVPVDVRDRSNATPLHLAARARRPEVVKLLLDHGADVNAADCMGTTPIEYPSGVSDNYRANYRETVELLVARGADVRHVDRNGETALHEAVFMENAAVVEMLLRQGADPNVSGVRGTPLAWARRKGYESIVKLLVKGGARQ